VTLVIQTRTRVAAVLPGERQRLVEGMAAKWDPEAHVDTHRRRILELVEEKAKHGVIETKSARGEKTGASSTSCRCSRATATRPEARSARVRCG